MGSGRNSQGNLPNVEDAGEQSTAARNVRKVPGYSTDIGVLLQLNNGLHNDIGIWANPDLKSGNT